MSSLRTRVGIAIVSPGGYAPDDLALASGIALLQAQGCRVKNYYEPAAKYLRFGASDERRAEQIHAAANDPDVQIVLALRGGYGMSRIMPLLDFKRLAASGKLFVGSSDFTAFNLGLLAVGGTSFAGPMLCNDFSRDDISSFTMDHFWGCLSGSRQEVSGEAPNNPEIDVSGTLWGGNLSMLSHLVGSSYFPRVENGILFLEDVSEHPYRIERMMLQLLYSGALAGQGAILMGAFSSYQLSDYDNGYDFETMLEFLRTTLPVPVLTGLPFGHVRDKATLAVGAHANLSVQGNRLRLIMSDYPSLQSALSS